MLFQTVLLIEDDKDDQEIFLTALGSLKELIKVIVRADAEEALTQLEAREICADVIFLDLVMPRMNGQRFLTEVKQRESLRKIPVIVLCTTYNVQIARELRQTEALLVLVKPDTLTELQRILRTILLD